ncbi:MAG: fasciclin domain-containing protein [Gemmatimonadota bacterium]
MKKTVLMSLALATTLSAIPSTVPAQATARAQNILEVAVADGSFKTLVAAVQAAGLAETLSGPGPFTVFAPTDAAFAKLPAGTVDALLADKTKLASILTYHVLSGKIGAGDVVKAGGAKPATVNGQTLDIVVRAGKVYVNGAQVVSADIVASNGVIHVIDSVLLPKQAVGAVAR